MKKPMISNFDLYEQIGEGNFGRVVRAYNKRDDRIVALKILPKEDIAQMKHSDHLVNEREVLSHLTEIKMMNEEDDNKDYGRPSKSRQQPTKNKFKL